MKLLPTLASILLIFVGAVSAEDSNVACAAQIAAILLNDDYEDALLAYNIALVNATIMCIQAQQTTCDPNLDSEQSAVEQACTEADGMMYTPTLSVQCDNSNTKVTTTWVQNYAFCIGLNCTNTDELEAEANELLANATSAVNELLTPDGVECSAQVSSSSNLKLYSGWVAAIGSVMSAAMLFVTFF
jgi:hypothetical protein